MKLLYRFSTGWFSLTVHDCGMAVPDGDAMQLAAYLGRQFRGPGLYFALAFSLTALGFWPSFFAALPTQPAPHLVHGLSATLWMLLPILQAWLIRHRLRAWHRRVGYAALLLAPIVVLSGLRVIQIMILHNIEDFQLRQLKFALLDITGLALFCVFLAWAIWSARRRDIGLHLRLIACTALIPLEAALERVLVNMVPALVPDFGVALYGALFWMETMVAALILAEWRLGRIRWPFPFMLGYYALMHAIATPVAQNGNFQAFAIWFARL